MQIVKKAQIPPSATMEINSLALQKRRAGERVYNLVAGEPMVATDHRIILAAERAMRDGHTHYGPVAGIPQLLEASCDWMNKTYNTYFETSNSIVTCGGKFGINAVCQALLQDDDEVLIISPFWVSYSAIPKLFGAKVKVIETTENHDWKISPADIENLASTKTKLLILNNASNPTGVLYTRDELEAILKKARELNIIVLSDEVYSGLVYDGREFISCGSFSEHRDNVIIIQSCSKIFAMTGWRVGFVFGPEEIIKAVKTIQGQSTTGTSTISQWAAVEAFENANEIISDVRAQMQKRRNLFVQEFNDLFSQDVDPPLSALYAFLPMKAFGIQEIDSTYFCKRVLDEANVAMVPGTAFGREGYVRCSFGELEKELKEALNVLKKYLENN